MADNKKSRVWFVIADRADARILLRNEDGCLEEVETLHSPEGEAQPHEVESDRQGYFRGKAGFYESCEPNTDYKHKVAERFARTIVDRIDKGRLQNEFDECVLVAEPMFLGVLRGLIPSPLEPKITGSIAKDYSDLKLPELQEKLSQVEAK